MKYAVKTQQFNPRRPAGTKLDSIWLKQQIEDDQADAFIAEGWIISATDNYMDALLNRLTPAQRDDIKYKNRARALDQIMAWMAVENMTRVRAGIWSVPQLISLTQDATVKEIISDLSSLSFEIAYSKIDLIAPAFVTPEIKATFKAKLAANFFNS